MSTDQTPEQTPGQALAEVVPVVLVSQMPKLNPLLDLDEVAAAYAEAVIPPCRVCGAKLSVASAGGGRATKWAHRPPEGVRAGDWRAHYTASEFTERQAGDSRVRALIAYIREVEALKELAEETS